jgi:hypothetical protein
VSLKQRLKLFFEVIQKIQAHKCRAFLIVKTGNGLSLTFLIKNERIEILEKLRKYDWQYS